jgi:hypothetical protein
MRGGLLSVHDPAPVVAKGLRNRADLKGFASSVTFVSELQHRLVALVLSPRAETANELAERCAWGVWQAGMHYDRDPMLPWDGVPYAVPRVYPHADEGSLVWSRPVVSPDAWLFVFGKPNGAKHQSARYLAAAVDFGFISGPARWDHRSQYTSSRRAPVGDGWKVGDVVEECDLETGTKQKRVKPSLHPARVLAALADIESP